MKLSRRNMLALAGAGVARAAAQTPAAPQPATPPANPDPLAKAREENQRSAANLAKFEIPMSTEPAFTFRA